MPVLRQHRIGQPAFERKYGLNLEDICAEFARLSTDTAMKEAMREWLDQMAEQRF